MKDTKSNSIPVRVSDKTLDRLKKSSERTGLPVSSLMRLSIGNGLDQLEQGILKLPNEPA